MSAPAIYPLVVGFGTRNRAMMLMGATPELAESAILMFYLEAGGHRILVDTGIGAPEDTLAHHHPLRQTEAQRPLTALARLGVRPDDIDIVVNTHLHWDHCFNNHLFPNATVYAQRAELAYAIAPLPLHTFAYDTIEYEPGRVVLPPFLRARLTLVDGDHELVDGVSLLLTPGHTPGSQAVVVRAGKTYILAGDNVPSYDNLPGRFKPHFTPNGIHVDLEPYYRSFARLARLGGEFLPSHDARAADKERYD